MKATNREVCDWCGEEFHEPFLMFMHTNKMHMYRLHWRCRHSMLNILLKGGICIWRGEEEPPRRCDECFFYTLDKLGHCSVGDIYIEDWGIVDPSCKIKVTEHAYKSNPLEGFEETNDEGW